MIVKLRGFYRTDGGISGDTLNVKQLYTFVSRD